MSTPPRRMWTIAPETLAPVIWVVGRGDGDGRRDAVEDQERRGQEAAADAEHAGQQPDEEAEHDDEQRVDRLAGDREVDVHARVDRTNRKPHERPSAAVQKSPARVTAGPEPGAALPASR